MFPAITSSNFSCRPCRVSDGTGSLIRACGEIRAQSAACGGWRVDGGSAMSPTVASYKKMHRHPAASGSPSAYGKAAFRTRRQILSRTRLNQEVCIMPERRTLDRARAEKRAGKSASTQAGEFVREEMEHIREGKHGARSAKQAIAIGLSKARRAGIDLKPPDRGKTSEKTRRAATRDYARGHGAPPQRPANPKRASASEHALERESHAAASSRAISRQARSAAKRRSPTARSASARKAAGTCAAHRMAGLSPSKASHSVRDH